MPRPLRTKVWDAYRAWEHGYGDIEVLHSAQQEAIDAVIARSTS